MLCIAKHYRLYMELILIIMEYFSKKVNVTIILFFDAKMEKLYLLDVIFIILQL